MFQRQAAEPPDQWPPLTAGPCIRYKPLTTCRSGTCRSRVLCCRACASSHLPLRVRKMNVLSSADESCVADIENMCPLLMSYESFKPRSSVAASCPKGTSISLGRLAESRRKIIVLFFWFVNYFVRSITYIHKYIHTSDSGPYAQYTHVTRLLGGVVVRALNLWSRDCRFDSQSVHCRVAYRSTQPSIAPG